MLKKISFALLLMGFTSLTVQILLIREFLITFSGNELTIGLVLANWIILEALGASLLAGASLKSKKPHLAYALLQLGITLYLPLSIFFIRTVKNAIGLTPGEGMGILPILLSSFFILAPLSFLDGVQFPFGCRILSDARGKPLESCGRAYILEAAGFIIAGPVFTYILITRMNSFSIASLLGLLNLFSAVLLLKDRLWDLFTKSLFIIINILLILVILAFFGPAEKLQKISINKQWRGQEVLNYKNTIYGNLAVTKSKNQYSFYSNGIPLITAPIPDIAYAEELVHFTMLAHPAPKNVLLLSGGPGGIIKEILKYPIKKLAYAELDPALIKLITDFPTALTSEELSDRRLDIQYIDGRRFLRLEKSQYDVVILNLPMPSTLQLNRFYTHEFFANVKSVLTKDGIFGFSLPGSLSYLNKPLRNLNGSILNTLTSVFYVNILPGDFNLYLASGSSFSLNPELFLKRLEKNNIRTRILNKSHLEYRMHPRWLKWFSDSLSGVGRIRKNFDLLPSGTFYSLYYWSTIFSQGLDGFFKALDKLNFRIALISLLLAGVILFILKLAVPKLKKAFIGLAIGTTGFLGMSSNLILIYAYQSFYGFIFSYLALLVTAFMSGLTLGGWQMTRRLTKIKNDFFSFSKIELAIVIFSITLAMLLSFLNRSPSLNLAWIFFVFSAVAGYLVGAEFPLANKIYWQDKTYTKTAGMLYSWDLLGAWLAALLVSVVLVPVIGIIKTCFLLAILKIISLILVWPSSRT